MFLIYISKFHFYRGDVVIFPESVFVLVISFKNGNQIIRIFNNLTVTARYLFATLLFCGGTWNLEEIYHILVKRFRKGKSELWKDSRTPASIKISVQKQMIINRGNIDSVLDFSK